MLIGIDFVIFMMLVYGYSPYMVNAYYVIITTTKNFCFFLHQHINNFYLSLYHLQMPSPQSDKFDLMLMRDSVNTLEYVCRCAHVNNVALNW